MLKLYVIGLGETHIKGEAAEDAFQTQLDDAAETLRCPPFRILWGSSRGSETHSGVAILVRASLLTSGALTIDQESISLHADGRLVHLKCS